MGVGMLWVAGGVVLLAGLLWWNYRNGNPTFWKAVASKPEVAFLLFKLDWQRWQVFEEEPPGGYRSVAPPAEWTGPFKLYLPSRDKTVVIFGRAKGLEETQQQMLRQLSDR